MGSSPLRLVGRRDGGRGGGSAEGGGPRPASSPFSAPAGESAAPASFAQYLRSIDEVPRSRCRRYHGGHTRGQRWLMSSLHRGSHEEERPTHEWGKSSGVRVAPGTRQGWCGSQLGPGHLRTLERVIEPH